MYLNRELVNQNWIKSENMVQYLLKDYMFQHLVCAFFSLWTDWPSMDIVLRLLLCFSAFCLKTDHPAFCFILSFAAAVFLNTQSALGGVYWTQLYGTSVKPNSCSDNPCISCSSLKHTDTYTWVYIYILSTVFGHAYMVYTPTHRI